MAAPLGFKTFNTGDVLTAADVNGYLMQGIWVFADATARDAAVTSPQEGNACYLKSTDQILVYSGSSWVVKSGASPLTTKGDLFTYSTTDARLPVGTNGQVLKADSTTATGLAWGAAGASNLASQDFTGSGTWTKPTGVTKAWVLLVGGGGAGGGASAGSNIAGGGGGGGMVKFEIVDVSAVSTVTVTIGTGGTGGTSYPAADGGDSTFGALLTAKGGKGAVRSTGTVADQNAGAYSSDTGSIGSGGGGGAGGSGGTATGLVYSTSWLAGYFEKYGGATGSGNSAGGTTKFYPGGSSAYIVGGQGGPGWWGFGGGGGGGIAGSGSLEGGKGSAGGGNGGAYVGQPGGNATANTGGGGGGACGDASARNGGNGGSGFCRVIWVA